MCEPNLDPDSNTTIIKRHLGDNWGKFDYSTGY